MELAIWIGIGIVSLIVLVKAADYFTKYSEKIGLALGISQFVIGVTIISIGTSLPELSTSLAGVFSGVTEIVVGDIIGSNVADILLGVGIAAIIASALVVKRSLINLDAPLLAGMTILLILMCLDRVIDWKDGVLLILGYVIYALYSYYSRKEAAGEKKQTKEKFKISYLIYVGLSAVAIFLGARYAIESVINISEILNISPSIIALTAIAVGTSLPEAIVAIVAAKKGNYEMALGGIFGSVIFNIGIAVGLPGLISPLEISDVVYFIGLPFLATATLLFVISGISRKIHNWEGAIYILIYTLFIFKLIEFI